MPSRKYQLLGCVLLLLRPLTAQYIIWKSQSTPRYVAHLALRKRVQSENTWSTGFLSIRWNGSPPPTSHSPCERPGVCQAPAQPGGRAAVVPRPARCAEPPPGASWGPALKAAPAFARQKKGQFPSRRKHNAPVPCFPVTLHTQPFSSTLSNADMVSNTCCSPLLWNYSGCSLHTHFGEGQTDLKADSSLSPALWPPRCPTHTPLAGFGDRVQPENWGWSSVTRTRPHGTLLCHTRATAV